LSDPDDQLQRHEQTLHGEQFLLEVGHSHVSLRLFFGGGHVTGKPQQTDEHSDGGERRGNSLPHCAVDTGLVLVVSLEVADIFVEPFFLLV
jgi:hypothetical protein